MSNQTEEIAKFREFQLFQAQERVAREKILKATTKRNDRCWCGSGRKYKKCCWGKE